MADEKTVVLQDIASVREFLIKLSKGIDPTCDLSFETDTVLNNKDIQRKLRQAESMLNEYYALIEKEEVAAQSARKRGTIKFILPQGAERNYPYSTDPITISHLAYLLNGEFKKEGMCNLKATTLTKLLEKEGYLYTIETSSGQINRIPTEKGISAGISFIERTNSHGQKYYVCLYDINAQKLVLEFIAKQ